MKITLLVAVSIFMTSEIHAADCSADLSGRPFQVGNKQLSISDNVVAQIDDTPLQAQGTPFALAVGSDQSTLVNLGWSDLFNDYMIYFSQQQPSGKIRLTDALSFDPENATTRSIELLLPVDSSTVYVVSNANLYKVQKITPANLSQAIYGFLFGFQNSKTTLVATSNSSRSDDRDPRGAQIFAQYKSHLADKPPHGAHSVHQVTGGLMNYDVWVLSEQRQLDLIRHRRDRYRPNSQLNNTQRLNNTKF